MVSNPPANGGDKGSTSGPGRYPHATKQLRPCTATIEAVLKSLGTTNYGSPWAWSRRSETKVTVVRSLRISTGE